MQARIRFRRSGVAARAARATSAALLVHLFCAAFLCGSAFLCGPAAATDGAVREGGEGHGGDEGREGGAGAHPVLARLLEGLTDAPPATGILLDRVVSLSNIEAFDGRPGAPEADARTWRRMLDELRRAALETPAWPAPPEVDALVRDLPPAVVPLGVLSLRYDRLREDALDTGALAVEEGRLVPGSGDPFTTRRVFSIAPLRGHTYRGGEVLFRLDPQAAVIENLAGGERAGDRDAGSSLLEFDFDDGRGFSPLAVGEERRVRYASEGEKTIRARATLADGTRLQAAARFEVRALQTPVPHDTLQVTGTIPYLGAVASGQAFVYLSDAHTALTEPVIVLEGFDLDNSMGWDALYDLLNREMLLETLRADGYDAVVVNFTDATDYIQRNAFLAIEVLAAVRAAIDPGKTVALAGASMGGVVGRYALAYMEQNAIEHGVRTFILFDSPQAGANIPLGLQYWLWFFADLADDAAAWLAALDSPAARQLLAYHHTDPPGATGETDALRIQMMAELAALGGYPAEPRCVAIANGSGSQADQGYAAGAQVIDWNYNSFLVDITGDIWAVPDGASHIIFDGEIDYLIGSDQNAAVTVSSTRPFDNAPGGWRSTLGDLDATDPGFGDIIAFHPNHCFIPTVSALDLATEELFFDIAGEPDLLGLTPFDAVYFPAANQEHVEIVAENADWLRAEIEAGPDAVDDPGAGLARVAWMAPPSPQPIAGAARLRCAVPAAGRARLALYDAAGRRVAVLAEEEREAGVWEFDWNGATGRGLPAAAGVYFVRLEGAGFAASAKAVVR